jgi:hypothetical protein
MKMLLLLSFFLFSTIGFCQELTIRFGPDIQLTKDTSILAVKKLWVSSITNSEEGFSSDLKDHAGVAYFIRAALEFPEFMGEMYVSDIEPKDGGYYQINNIWSLNYGDNTTLVGKFKVYALKTQSNIKLYNAFEFNKPKLKTYIYKNFTFYYLPNFPFNSQKAIAAVDECYRISELYGIKQNKTDYVIGHTMDEAWANIGFDYSPLSSPSPYAGRKMINLPIILSCREDHLHEMIHNIFMASSNNALFQEGIATYYAGTNGLTYYDLLATLKQSIVQMPNVDLTNIRDLDCTLNNKLINNYYVLGAIFIEYALNHGGINKVLSLVHYQDPNFDDFSDDFEFIEKELNIPKNKVNSFLKDYILNYIKK